MSSQVLSGIATESDLSESERQALIAFKTALNERLPQIFSEASTMQISADANPNDKAFAYLLENYVLNDRLLQTNPELQVLKTLYAALPEKTQPIPLPENVAANTIASLSEDQRVLAEFKHTINQRLPDIIPATASMTLDINGDALDGALIYLLDNYILNEELIAEKPELAELRDQYNALPAETRALTETYKTFFTRPSNQEGKNDHAQAVITLAEDYLGTNDGAPDDGSIKIDQNTSRALRDRLEELKSTNEVDVDFDTRVFDQRTVDFLNAIVHKRAKDANAPESSLDGMVVQLWSLRNNGIIEDSTNGSPPSNKMLALGEAISLRNIASLMVNAELPSGPKTTKPETDVNWDTQWTTNDSGDRFFSNAVYRDIKNNKTVTTDILFDKPGYNDDNYAVLMKAAERLDLDMSRGRVMSQMELGEVAIEIMSIRAEEAWCMINPGTEFDETKIHEMIHKGQFMPHLDDLFLAEKGFGVPETEYFRKQIEELGPEGSWHLEYKQRTAVLSHRADAFAERFGEMPQSALETKARAYSTTEEHVRHSYGTPALYFGSVGRGLFGNKEPTTYEIARDVYLERYQAFKEDVGTCDPKATADNENDPTNTNGGPCTVEGVLRGETFPDAANADETNCDCIKTNVEDATGNPQGDCTVEDELERRMSVENAPAN